ncbi:hypothetical protein ES703_87086 [subsurface metagenome]
MQLNNWCAPAYRLGLDPGLQLCRLIIIDMRKRGRHYPTEHLVNKIEDTFGRTPIGSQVNPQAIRRIFRVN